MKNLKNITEFNEKIKNVNNILKILENFDDFEYVNDDEPINGKIHDLEDLNKKAELRKSFDKVSKDKENKHSMIEQNYKKYGTIKPNFTTDQCIIADNNVSIGTSKGQKIYKIDIQLVGLSEYKDKHYSGTSGMGLLVKIDNNGNLINIDEKLSKDDLDKVMKYISDNVKLS